MIIPDFWAEAGDRREVNGEERHLRRFGWSNESRGDAEAHAQQRLSEAFAAAIDGEHVEDSDRRVPYNGAEGMPIREEVIERFGDSVITRNSYGALCLNTPAVCFVDIDLPEIEMGCTSCLLAMGVLMGACFFAWQQESWAVFGIGVAVSLVFGVVASMVESAIEKRMNGDPEAQAQNRIRAFAQEHPDWHLRVYRSPNGFRVLVMDRLLDPQGHDAETIFRELGADPMYVQMCQRQACFRARVSPKPWRIGLDERMTPRGVWPIPEERMGERTAWVASYNGLADDYASCRFIEHLGSERSEAEAELVRAVHDKLCQSDSELPLA